MKFSDLISVIPGYQMLDISVVSPYPIDGDIVKDKHKATSYMMSAHHLHTSGILTGLDNLEVTLMETAKLECNNVTILKVCLRGYYNTEYKFT